jgi:CBS domain containing-hemolysin-like protein
VTDQAGRVAGLITLEDVASELLGGVADEFKPGRRQAAPSQERGRA